MSYHRLIAGAAVLTLGASPVFAGAKDEPVTLEPSSPWNVHYADDYCRLMRIFGEGEQRTVLMMDRYAPGDSLRLTLAGDITKAAVQGGKAKLQFGPGWDEQELQFFSGTTGEKLSAWIFGVGVQIRPLTKEQKAQVASEIEESGLADIASIAPMSEADEAATTQIRFGRPLRRPLVLHTGPMKAPLDAMRACTDELVTHWGVDAVRIKTASRPVAPIESPGKWLRSGDYPTDMLRKGMPGLVYFRLTVGEDGTPESCHIQKSTNPEGFDKAVCDALMRRARFTLALDAEGKPLKAYYLSTVRFQIP